MNASPQQPRKFQPRILEYQRDRGLDELPGYPVGIQVNLPHAGRVYIAVSGTELALYFETNIAIHYDLESRLVKVSEPNQYWRRGLGNRIVHSRKRTAAEGGGITRTVLTEAAAVAVIAQAHQAVSRVVAGFAQPSAEIESAKPDLECALKRVGPLLDHAAKFDVDAARRDERMFQTIYRSVAVLPPNEYNALVLQATEGCAHNQCLFCQLYRDTRFRIRSHAEFEDHVLAVIAHHGDALRSRRGLFLGEANSLVIPQARLLDNLAIINRYFELPDPDELSVPASWWLGSRMRFDGVGSFLDVFTGHARSTKDWMELRHHGLRRVYIGLESGSDNVLQWLRKPATAAAVSRCVTSLKEAHISVALIVILGAGGWQFAAEHVAETARLINQLPLGSGDYIYLSPLVIYDGGPYDVQAFRDHIQELSAADIDAQEEALRAALQSSSANGRPYIARYDLETFIY